MVMVVEIDKKNALEFFVVSQHMTIDDLYVLFFFSSFHHFIYYLLKKLEMIA